jgi:hypothetical protein
MTDLWTESLTLWPLVHPNWDTFTPLAELPVLPPSELAGSTAPETREKPPGSGRAE